MAQENWEEKNQTSPNNLMSDLNSLIEESISIIQRFEPEEGYFLGFSGGKDSIVLYHIAKKAKVKFEAFYTATGIDPPCLVKFIMKEYPDVKFLRPKESFYKLVERKGIPTFVARWCCDQLKKNPAKKPHLKYHLLGIRAEESPRRRNRGFISQHNGEIQIYPIFNWKEEDVWAFIKERNLNYPKLYEKGFKRLGCTVCPLQSQRSFELSQTFFPKQFEAFRKAARRFWETHPNFQRRGSFEEIWNYFLKHRSIPPIKGRSNGKGKGA